MKIIEGPSVTQRHKEKMIAKMAAEKAAKVAGGSTRAPTCHQGSAHDCLGSEVE